MECRMCMCSVVSNVIELWPDAIWIRCVQFLVLSNFFLSFAWSQNILLHTNIFAIHKQFYGTNRKKAIRFLYLLSFAILFAFNFLIIYICAHRTFDLGFNSAKKKSELNIQKKVKEKTTKNRFAHFSKRNSIFSFIHFHMNISECMQRKHYNRIEFFRGRIKPTFVAVAYY